MGGLGIRFKRTVAFRVDEATYKKLCKIARQEKMRISELLRDLLATYLESKEEEAALFNRESEGEPYDWE